MVQLAFSQAVVAGQTSIAMWSDGGERAQLGRVETSDDNNVVRAEVVDELPPGEYRVEWHVVARDGDSMIGEYRFVVGAGSVLGSARGESATCGPGVAGLLRWVIFGGVALALGGLVGSSCGRRDFCAEALDQGRSRHGVGVVRRTGSSRRWRRIAVQRHGSGPDPGAGRLDAWACGVE